MSGSSAGLGAAKIGPMPARATAKSIAPETPFLVTQVLVHHLGKWRSNTIKNLVSED
jgi:hypothetical protein